MLYRPLAPEKLSEGIVSHGKDAAKQDDLHILPCIIKRIRLRAQPPHDGGKEGYAGGCHEQAVEDCQLEADRQRMPCLCCIFRPQTPGNQGGSSCADHIGDRNGDHHDRIGQIDRCQLIVVPHQPDKIGVHQVVEHHDEHARDQGKAQLYDGQRRLFTAQDIDPPVLFLHLSFSLFSLRCCILLFIVTHILCHFVSFGSSGFRPGRSFGPAPIRLAGLVETSGGTRSALPAWSPPDARYRSFRSDTMISGQMR